MTTPQLENGYIRIATDIAKYLAQTYMSSYESQIMWSIFIKTYGFKKKEDWISNSQFVNLTKMHKAHVSRTIKKLILRRIVTQTGNKISFQKDATRWCELPKQATVTQTGNSVAHSGNRQLPKQADTIDTLTKDNIQKIIIQGSQLSVIENQKELTRPDTLTDHSVSHYVIELFRDLNPDVARLHKLKGEADAAITLYRNAVKGNLDQLERAIKAIPEIAGDTFAPKDIKSISKPSQLLTHWALYCAQARGRKEKIKSSGPHIL